MEQDEYTALRPYPCDFCSRRFRKKASLNNHMLAHQNDRPHLCKLCGARFTRRAELISHFKAHAEAQDAADAEAAAAAAAAAVSASSIKYEYQSQRQLDEHFYEQEWSLSHQDQGQVRHEQHNHSEQQLISNHDVADAYPALVAPPAAPARGRISRLKPKEESSQFIVMAERQSSPNLGSNCLSPTEQPTVASAQSGTAEPPPQPNYPILDDKKPFVCQQCGLAFAREKALVSHTKVGG